MRHTLQRRIDLLAPLRKGAHEIHFRSIDSPGFNLEVTYHLTVGEGKDGEGKAGEGKD